MRDAVVRRLAAAGCVDAAQEAVVLLDAAPDAVVLDAWIARRTDGEPLPWIVGTVRFGPVVLRQATGVYVPRPHSVELARRAAAALVPGGRLLDLCCGGGAIAAYVQRAAPAAAVVGVERDPIAARGARANGVAVIVGDLDGPIRSSAASAPARFDVVTAVAPYVPSGELRLLQRDVVRYEGRAALDGGSDGLDVVRRVVVAASGLLRPGGLLLVEIGGDQDQRIAPDLVDAGFGDAVTWHDEDGDVRGVAARRS